MQRFRDPETIEYTLYSTEEESYCIRHTLPAVFEFVKNEELEKLRDYYGSPKKKNWITRWFPKQSSFEYRGHYNNTPLHVAALLNKIKSVEFILNFSRKSVDATNHFNQTPLFKSCKFNSNLLIMTPKKYITIKNSSGIAVIQLTEEEVEEKIRITQKLIEAGANVNRKDIFGNTPLHFSIGNPAMTHFLIQNGADINAVNNFGNSPLELAVFSENLDTVCMLLYYNCDTTIKDKTGHTPFLASLYTENEDIQEALLPYVDDFNLCNNRNESMLSISIYFKSTLSEKILSHCQVRFDDLISSLLMENTQLFKKIWVKLELNQFDKLLYFLKDESDPYLTLNFIDLMLENSDDLRLESLVSSFNRVKYAVHRLYILILSKKLETPDSITKKLTKTCMILLEYNYIFFINYFCEIYVNFGYCQLFKHLLYMDLEKDDASVDRFNTPWIMPLYIYNIHCDMKTLCIKCDPFMRIEFNEDHPEKLTHLNVKAAIGCLNFSVDTCLVDLIRSSFQDDCEFKKIDNKIPTVPSLLQLARDKTRKHIVNKFNFTKTSQYYTYINKLELNSVYKKILTLESQIYNFK